MADIWSPGEVLIRHLEDSDVPVSVWIVRVDGVRLGGCSVEESM